MYKLVSMFDLMITVKKAFEAISENVKFINNPHPKKSQRVSPSSKLIYPASTQYRRNIVLLLVPQHPHRRKARARFVSNP